LAIPASSDQAAAVDLPTVADAGDPVPPACPTSMELETAIAGRPTMVCA
jgi:hypothetical protein